MDRYHLSSCSQFEICLYVPLQSETGLEEPQEPLRVVQDIPERCMGTLPGVLPRPEARRSYPLLPPQRRRTSARGLHSILRGVRPASKNNCKSQVPRGGLR
jgi:hypothetical protein